MDHPKRRLISAGVGLAGTALGILFFMARQLDIENVSEQWTGPIVLAIIVAVVLVVILNQHK